MHTYFLGQSINKFYGQQLPLKFEKIGILENIFLHLTISYSIISCVHVPQTILIQVVTDT